MRISFFILLLISFVLPAKDNRSVAIAKKKIQLLDSQIHQLKKTLANAHDKRGVLNKELADTEKLIGASVRKSQLIQQDMLEKQRSITTLEKRKEELDKQLSMQQDLLAKHIRIRYKMGEYLPVKWIINQDDPYFIGRLLTFHQYLVHSRQQVIDEIDQTQKNITLNQEKLTHEVEAQRALQDQLALNQKTLERNKQYHKTVIHSLNNEIQTKELTLQEFERNKENLSHIINRLAVQSVVPQSRQSFEQMQHKLAKPVHVDGRNIKKTNQGVTFLAAEGTSVHAVYPGKVVFSDWLNGYGLLIIIDHGHGFMTLYAHNQSLYKHKGSIVRQNEQIAIVGHSGGIKQNGLYFEVRQRGKAIPPLNWLS